MAAAWEARYPVMVYNYDYFLALGAEIPIFLNFLLDIGLRLWLFKYHG
jgi:hypothetical protein